MKALAAAGRIRVVDALVAAAIALLVLKGVALLSAEAAPEPPPGGLPAFARVLANARTNYVPPDPTVTGSVPAAAPAAANAAAPPPMAGGDVKMRVEGLPPESSSERAIREKLAERREELQGKARDLAAREKLIEEVERRNDARAEEARIAEARKQDSAAGAAAESETAALKNVVVMYETMKPKEAARVFDRLPQEVLVSVARQIAPRKMAEIMAAMSPDAAQRLTVSLARRERQAAASAEDRGAAGLPPGELPSIEPPRQDGRGR